MISEAPIISDGMNQRIGALVVDLTTAKTMPEWLHASSLLAAAANSHVLVYMREIGNESPSIEKIRIDLQDKISAAQSTKPEAGTEDMEMWTQYVKDIQQQQDNVVDLWGSRVAYREFVTRWDSMYEEWENIIGAMSMMIEGEMAQVFNTRRKPKRHVFLPVDPPAPNPIFGIGTMRDMMMQAMGLHDYGQEVVTSNIEIMRGIGVLDRRMFAAASDFDAIFAEIFGDLTVYRDNYLQYLSLHRADEKGRLEEALREQEMRGGGSEY